MTYQTALEWLYGLQKHGIKLGLETIRMLLDRLGDPQKRFASLHIAGTNGKGSTAAMTASVLDREGYRVGLYTSPHLVDFRERIRVAGIPIPEESVVDLTARLLAFTPESAATLFEFTTAMAFAHFAAEGVEVAVIEVGMGGRFDATNVVMPLASVITNVALDHQEYLGDTLAAIAFEKAGIIKNGVPLALGHLEPEAVSVIERVGLERQAPRYCLGLDFRTAGDPQTGFRYDGLERSYDGLTCPLPGLHQLENAGCALAMLELAHAQGLRLTEQAVRDGLRSVAWPGRLEWVDGSPPLLLDGGHNPAAAKALAAYLRGYRQKHPEARLILVVGMMRDKDRRGFLQTLLPFADELVLTQAQLARAATVDELESAVRPVGGPIHHAPFPPDALTMARRLARSEDVICVTGSLILVGEVKAILQGCGLSPIRG